jgi:autotransporter-associated beta strand protein
MEKTTLFVCAVAFFAAVQAESIYTVTESITSGGIDLTALGDEYRKDAIAGKAAGANLPIAITGRVVHASGLTPENPFIVSNVTSSSYFILKDADLVGKVPILTRGNGTIYFPGTTLTNDSVEANGLFRARAATQIDNLVVAGKDTPGMMYMTNSTFYVLKNTYIGRNGGSGTIYSTVTCLGRTNSGGNELPWLGQRNTGTLYFGSSSAKGNGFSSGKLHLVNNHASAWSAYWGNTNNDLPPDDGQEHYVGELILDGANSYLVILYGHVRGATDSIIRFKGGKLSSHGWGTYLSFDENTSANLICQGEGGKPINLFMNKYSSFVTWGSGATGHLILRGDSNVYLYGGDGQGQSQNFTLEDGSNYPNTEGGVTFRDANHRIEWLQTGDLQFRTDGSKVAKIGTSYFFPSNSWNGGVSIGDASTFFVNLLGTSQACNSLFGGGKLTNGVLSKASTIYIGAHGNDCKFDATLCNGGAINIVKRGAGVISLMKPIPYALTLEQGSAVIPANSTFTTSGSLVTAAGTSISLQGSTFAPPADYDMNGSTTAAFMLDSAGTLVLGGDGADQTVDFSKISGSGIIRKIGANTVTFVNASGFTGAFDVQGGTLAVPAAVGTLTLASVTVAPDSTLSLAGGVRINTGALTVRGTVGDYDSIYGGAEGATALDGISGEGSIYLVPPSATWTGAVDDDPENLGNWTGLVTVDALFTGLLTVNFSSADPAGAWNVTKAYSFKGMNFDAGVTGFSFNKSSDAAKMAVGVNGIVIAGDRSAVNYFDFNTPVDFMALWSTLDFGTNAYVRFHAPLGGLANGGQTINKIGSGRIYLYSTNSTYDGSVSISNGYVYAYGNEPFGPANATGTSQVFVDGYKSAKVYLSNVFTSKNFKLQNNATYRTALHFLANTTNTVAGNISCGSVCKLDIPASTLVYMDGGYGTAATRSSEYVNWNASGKVVFRDKPFYAGTIEATVSDLHLNCPGNYPGDIFGWSDPKAGGDPYQCASGNITFGCDWALDNDSEFILNSGVIDLNGTKQRFGSFRTTGTVRSLNAPGTLYLACATGKSFRNGYANTNTMTPSTGAFAGLLSLVIDANDNFTFGISNRVVSATGNVEVVRGTLKFCGTASWLNATNVTVSGGTLVVPHSKTLGRYTEVFLKSGSMQLDAGVEQKVKFLYLDGSAKRARTGKYGALDNESVPSAHRTARITGPGVLNVMGECSGAVLFFK